MFSRNNTQSQTYKIIQAGGATVKDVVLCQDFVARYSQASKEVLDFFRDPQQVREFVRLLMTSETKSIGRIATELFRGQNPIFRHIFETYADLFAETLSCVRNTDPHSRYITGVIWELISSITVYSPSTLLNMFYLRPDIFSLILAGMGHPTLESAFLEMAESDVDIFLVQYFVWHMLVCVFGPENVKPAPLFEGPGRIDYPRLAVWQLNSILRIAAAFLREKGNNWGMRPLWELLTQTLEEISTFSPSYLTIAAHLPYSPKLMRYASRMFKKDQEQTFMATLEFFAAKAEYILPESLVHIMAVIFCCSANPTSRVLLATKKVVDAALSKNNVAVKEAVVKALPFMWNEIAKRSEPVKSVVISLIIAIADGLERPRTAPWNEFEAEVLSKWRRDEAFVGVFNGFGPLLADATARDEFEQRKKKFMLGKP